MTDPADVPCNDLVELVTDYLDDALPPEWRERIEAHLAICEGCRRVVAQWQLVIRLGGRVAETDVDAVDPGVRGELLAAFRRRRDEA